MKRCTNIHELKEFQSKYEAISGLALPYEYLESSDVYVYQQNNRIIGGFVLGYQLPFRTVEVFASEINRPNLRRVFNKEQFCEICCFWVDKAYRKKLLVSVTVWLKMAYTVKTQKQPFVLFGTNSKGLTKMYGYPKNSCLYHKDHVSNKHTFVFLARRTDFFGGVWEIVVSKLLKFERNRNIEKKPKLHNALSHEISI